MTTSWGQVNYTVKKKTAHASEQGRCDVMAAREAWFDGQVELEPERLIFLDGTVPNRCVGV